MHVCVLGAAGFIGRHVVAEALSRGYPVIAVDMIDRPPAGTPAGPLYSFRQGQLTDPGFVRRVMSEADAVICLAPSSLPATSNADMAGEIGGQVQTTLKIAEIAQDEGVRSFVFASSGGTVYGIDSLDAIPEGAPTRPRNAYGVSKLAIEHYLRVLRDLRGLRTLSLRIANPYGAGQSAGTGQGFIAAAMQRAHQGEVMSIWGDGGVVRDFIYVKDLAEAMVSAASYEGEEPVMNLGSGLGYSLLEIATRVEVACGRRLRLQFEPNRSIDVSRNVLDISLAQRELDWQPRTSIEHGLAETAAWWAERALTRS